MANNRKIGLVAGIVLVMVLLVWLFSSGEKDQTQNQRRPFVSSNWSKRYQLYDKNPHGLYLFDELLSAYIDTSNRVNIITDWNDVDTSRNFIEEPKTFVFVGNAFGLHDNEMDSLMEHVENGSTLFMSYNNLTENLYGSLFYDLEMQYDYDDHVNVFSDKGKYGMINIFQNDTIARQWFAFGEVDCMNEHTVLSSFMEMENFIEFEYGLGRVLLHSNPNMFFNYQLKRKDGFEYNAYVLSQLDKNRDVYYLELGRLSDNFGNYDEENEGADGKEDRSFLRLIFENKYLLTALLLSVIGAILFVIFRSKRTRPVVPYLPEKKDMTLAFTETITSIYYAKRNPYGILNLLRKNFYSAVQRYFFIDLAKRKSDLEIQLLAEKTNTSFRDLKEMLELMETTEAFSVNDHYVADVQKRQHKFYRKTGIISDRLSEALINRQIEFKRSLLLPAVMILCGIILIIMGLYYLTVALGIGIILWPLGILLTALGSLRIAKPYLVIEGDKLTYYTSLGRKRDFMKSEIQGLDAMKGGIMIRFKDNRKLAINYWDLSRFHKKQFERFISKIEK